MTQMPITGSGLSGGPASAVGNQLTARGPSWLTVPAGVIAGGALAAAVLGGAAMAFGLVVVPYLLIGAAGFFALTLGLGALLCPRRQYTTAQLFSTCIAVGHCLLLAGFIFAVFTPQGLAYAQILQNALPRLPFVQPSDDPIMVAGPVYLAVFTLFSAFAPFSLIIFRYISLTRRK